MDDADRVMAFRVCNENYCFVKQTDGNEALFFIRKSVVFVCARIAVKDFNNICEVDTVLTDIGAALGCVPLEFHCSYITSLRQGQVSRSQDIAVDDEKQLQGICLYL